MAKRSSRSFVVIGLGAFGGTVATALTSMGDEVLGIDSDERRVREHAEKITHAIIADARDEEALKEAGVAQHDVAVVSIGENLEASILCAMNLKLIGIPTIWVKAISRTHHRILTKIGVDRVIRPERDMGMHVAETLHTPYVVDYLSLGNGFHVINLLVPEDTRLKTTGDLQKAVTKGVRLMGIMRGTEFISPTIEDIAIREGDRIVVLGRRDDLRLLAGAL